MICIGNKPPNLPFIESEAPERYLGLNFTKKGLNSKITAITKSIKESLSKWKSQAYTIRTKMAIVKTYALSKLTYHQYIDSLEKSHIEELNNVIKWFLYSSIKYTYTEEKKYRTLMTMDRAFGEWKDGGIKMWDLGVRQAFKVWNLNRLLHINKNNSNNTLQDWYIEQIRSGNYRSISLRENVDNWKQFRTNFYPQHNKLKYFPDCIKNNNNKPIKLKEIYNHLINKKFNSTPRQTEGQKELKSQHNINLSSIFQFINNISLQKGRNTLFRFFSRTLPGINHERYTQCKICNSRFSDPYIHYFINCNNIKNIEKSIVSTFNKLSFLKIRKWDLGSMDVSKTNKKERIYANLIGIITHHIWINICYKLFNQEPVFHPVLIEKEIANLIKIEKFMVMKKIEQNENFKNINSRDLLITRFNNSWQNPVDPYQIPL